MATLATNIGWMASMLKTSIGVSGRYVRSETDESATLTVIPGRTDREQQSDRGLINVVGSEDIKVVRADFEGAFGDGAEPADGDRWECGGRVYRVRPLGGEPGSRKMDSGDEMTGVMLRIHLKDEGPIA